MEKKGESHEKDPLHVALGKHAAEVKHHKPEGAYGGPKLSDFEHNEEGKIPELVEASHQMTLKKQEKHHHGRKSDVEGHDTEGPTSEPHEAKDEKQDSGEVKAHEADHPMRAEDQEKHEVEGERSNKEGSAGDAHKKDPVHVALGKHAAEVKYHKPEGAYGGPKLSEFEHNEEGKIVELVEAGHHSHDKKHHGESKAEAANLKAENKKGTSGGEHQMDSTRVDTNKHASEIGHNNEGKSTERPESDPMEVAGGNGHHQKDPVHVALGKHAAEVKYHKPEGAYGSPKLSELKHNEEGKIPELVEAGHHMQEVKHAHDRHRHNGESEDEGDRQGPSAKKSRPEDAPGKEDPALQKKAI